MKKLFLPALTIAALAAATPATAQTLTVRDPFNSIFDAMLFPPQRFEMQQFAGPKMNVADLKDKIEVKAELPGLDKDAVTLTCEDGVLTLSGERQQETEEQNKDYYLKEISTGAFSRSIRLPKDVDDTKIEAVFKNGVLTITIPKKEVKKDAAKKIKIKG